MTSASYDPNTPQFLSDSFATTQPQFQTNFQTLFAAFAKNHVSITAAANAGNHNIIELLGQLNPIQTDVGEINIYTKDVEGQTEQVFFRYQGNQKEFQFTNYQIYALPPTKDLQQFFTFLPGRLIVYFGSFTGLVGPTRGALTLELQPAIAKNIIGMTFCPRFTIAFPPSVRILPEEEGFIKKIDIFHSSGSELAPPDSFYIIVANT